VASFGGIARRVQIQNLLAVLLLILATSVAAQAQWEKATYPGTPHAPDGKPDVNAPAPRLPDGKIDLSGVWHAINFSWVHSLPGEGVDVPMVPAAAALYKERLANMGEHNPQLYCLPHSIPDAELVADIPFKFIVTPHEIVQIFEEFNQYRQIYTDGRTLSKDPNPAWFGYSSGRWEGDVFIVEVGGFKEGSWLDNVGHPRSEQAHITERYRRLNFGSMELDVTVDDPASYLKPWKVPTVHLKLMPENDLIEHLCENNRDIAHENVFTDKTGDDKK
jgi:hypothetical protein